jgi:hypothetical protein
MMMAPHHKTEIKGGIFSRWKLVPTLEDRLKGNDLNSMDFRTQNQ